MKRSSRHGESKGYRMSSDDGLCIAIEIDACGSNCCRITRFHTIRFLCRSRASQVSDFFFVLLHCVVLTPVYFQQFVTAELDNRRNEMLSRGLQRKWDP